MSVNHQDLLSPVIAGTMKWGQWGEQFSTRQYEQIIAQAVELGVTSFDHADIYGHYTTEEDFGAALRNLHHLRPRIQLITKCGIKMVTSNRPSHSIKSYDTSKTHILESVNRSLKNLSTDYIDLLLIHRPDPLMNPSEIAEAFNELKQSGKVLHFGVSNFLPSQASLIDSYFPLMAHQVEISILKMEAFSDGTLDQCIQRNWIPMAWSPLGGGKLFGENDRNKRISAVANLLAAKYGLQDEQIILAWLMMHPSRIKPVLGTSRIDRIKLAMDAKNVKLLREEWFMLWRASTGHEVA